MIEKKIKMILGIVLAVILLVIMYAVLKYIDTNSEQISSEETMDETEEDEEFAYIELGDQAYRLDHDVKSYLFMGTDASGNEDVVGEDYRGSMADFLMLIVVDEENKSYGMLQFNRDTMTTVWLLQSDGTSYASAELQLCTAHWYGGDKKSSCENTVRSVSNLLGGVHIDGYYALPMEEMRQLNAAVGGVTITLDEDLTEIDPAMKAGATLKLTDEQAEEFVRARMNVGDGENTSRMKRQKLFLDSFLVDVQKQNQEFLIKLYDELKAYSTADINMKKVSSLATSMNSYTSKGVLTMEGELKLGKNPGDEIEHTQFYPEEDSIEKVVKALYPLVEVDTEEINREDIEE